MKSWFVWHFHFHSRSNHRIRVAYLQYGVLFVWVAIYQLGPVAHGELSRGSRICVESAVGSPSHGVAILRICFWLVTQSGRRAASTDSENPETTGRMPFLTNSNIVATELGNPYRCNVFSLHSIRTLTSAPLCTRHQALVTFGCKERTHFLSNSSTLWGGCAPFEVSKLDRNSRNPSGHVHNVGASRRSDNGKNSAVQL